jgi:ParB family transcriptional regulator, chromosome partitioning protein
MGRGLAAILAVTDEPATEDGDLRHIPLDLIAPNPRQPRRSFDQASLQALADSVRERGIVQPVLVRPVAGGTYELVAGERRWRAAQIAGMESMPALVRPRDDSAALEIALIENMAREDLNPVEEARACAALVEELGLTREDVSNLVRLLDLPDDILGLLEAGELTEGHGRALLLAEDHGDRRTLGREAAREGWTVRVTEEKAREANARDEIRVSRRKGGVHPDQAAAATEVGEALGRALGVEVRVRPTPGGGYRAELTFDDADQAHELAARLAGEGG